MIARDGPLIKKTDLTCKEVKLCCITAHQTEKRRPRRHSRRSPSPRRLLDTAACALCRVSAFVHVSQPCGPERDKLARTLIT